MATTDLLQCYNKGCGQKYNPVENKEGMCKFHPGGPIFHDALKGWSCCKKRSTDFTEFLNIPGCSSGMHSNEKPAEAEKPASSAKKGNDEMIQVVPEVVHTPITAPPPRPSEDVPLTKLKCSVGATLKQALEKQMQELSVNVAEDDKDGSVKIGTSCKNKGCKKEYEGENSDKEVCVFHSGVPVFHEGMKYWSCCQRKTSDFNNFLDQEGCTNGTHLWVAKESESQKVKCRYDWHQTATFVTMSVFAKVASPELTVVEANQVILNLKIVFDGGKSVFEERISLQHAVDPAKSSVKLLGTKVEVNLKKAEPCSWSKLESS
ncbi:hypothetical protein CAPTEDRAFT_165685 [Capitella teleta]|uniref:Cysteine and histidine-rich domain-containing protein 1 n=1 Tax=Capitella teleta TaxID=283909 RepID=X1ZAF4_CAPTE|nr:hypothetical protein CAPTEDRAFT_165685 [Capitella teleta]|eukprot:ELU00349.1 hypothetical protein CAPTEDRAFT_165685 [Capitella teleta]